MTQASVLVVEDNDLERQITADTLREEGFAVEEAAVGKRAIELLALSRLPLELVALAKATAHWVATGLPLALTSPVLALVVGLDPSAIPTLFLGLLVGTPALTFTGMIGAALAVTMHRGGLLLAVLVLPLSIPVLIFGVAASQAAITGLSFGAPFSILCALSLVSFVIGPFAAAASLRHGLD